MESTSDPLSLCRRVREAGMRAGVALKPGTPAEAVAEYVAEGAADMVLVMTVEPGFGGQKFMADMMGKVTRHSDFECYLKKIFNNFPNQVRFLRESYPLLDIEVDGGVGPATIDEVAKARDFPQKYEAKIFRIFKCFARRAPT